MFDSVLIANRGEIAVRIIRSLRRLGIRSVAVYSEPDAQARHVAEADAALCIGPAPAIDSYLRIDHVIDAALQTNANAIHPGYGFLAENAEFAQACGESGLVFIGPPASAIKMMGDKIQARRFVAGLGVPIVPGRDDPELSDEDIAAAASDLGFPVLLKPAFGGGGKGMRLVHSHADLTDQIKAARREAHGSFGNSTLIVERYLPEPRHIEVQIVSDQYGAVLHLGERECSLQRRYQKIIEESPSPFLTTETRAILVQRAVDIAKASGYYSAGTVEFVASAQHPDQLFFLEMNTRLQVEHPVTELVTGLDLIEMQVRIAAGEPLRTEQRDVSFSGHAIEARVYAEDTNQQFLPTGGTILRLAEPSSEGIRVDSGLAEGMTIGSHYDPMLAKVIAHGEDRLTAIRRLDQALAETVIMGVRTNIGHLRGLLANPDVRAGRLHTELVASLGTDLDADSVSHLDIAAAAVLLKLLELEPSGSVTDIWEIPTGWRISGTAWQVWRLVIDDSPPVTVRTRRRSSAAEVIVDDGSPCRMSASRHGGMLVVQREGGGSQQYVYLLNGRSLWLGQGGRSWHITEFDQNGTTYSRQLQVPSGPLRSPMPGTVTVVSVSVGDQVTAGMALLVVEAMKMEHVIVAPADGVVTELTVQPGQSVGMSQPLVTVTTEGGNDDDAAAAGGTDWPAATGNDL